MSGAITKVRVIERYRLGKALDGSSISVEWRFHDGSYSEPVAIRLGNVNQLQHEINDLLVDCAETLQAAHPEALN